MNSRVGSYRILCEARRESLHREMTPYRYACIVARGSVAESPAAEEEECERVQETRKRVGKVVLYTPQGESSIDGKILKTYTNIVP